MKKFLSLVLALCMCAMMTVAGLAESRMPEELNGTYIDLFPEFAKEEYKDCWMENIGKFITDAEAAEGTYTAMTQGFMGTLKGQAAIDAYAADPADLPLPRGCGHHLHGHGRRRADACLRDG